MAELPSDAPLCSPELSECHRELAREHETTKWLRRQDVVLAAAAARERNYTEEERRRRVEHLNAVRPQAVAALQRRAEAERESPELAAARKIARSQVHRKLRSGTECPICGVWFCTAVAPGRDDVERKFCSDACRRERMRRVRTRTWLRQKLTG